MEPTEKIIRRILDDSQQQRKIIVPEMSEEEMEKLALEETTLRQEGRIVVTSFV